MPRGYEPAGFADAIEGTVVPSPYYDNADAWDNWYECTPPDEKFVPNLGTVTLIDIEEGDGNMDGTHVTLIFKLDTIDGVTQYFRKEGWVDEFAYNRNWDPGVVEIEPKPTTVTVWKDK